MARADSFQVSLVTPERVVLECDARFVALPAHDGEIGILRGRAPLVCKLAIGRLRIETATDKHLFYIEGGFAEVAGDRLTVLTGRALRPEALEPAAVAAGLAEARALPAVDEADFEERQKALQRARVQGKMVGK